MSRKNLVSRLGLAIGVGAFVLGCSSKPVYYEITDPQSGNQFYTTKIKRPSDDSYLLFTSAKSGSEVRLTEFEVKTISEGDYQKAISDTTTTKPDTTTKPATTTPSGG